MAAQKANLISGNRLKAAVDEPTAAVSAIATSCDAQEQRYQVVDIRSSQEANNNNIGSAIDESAERQELKKPESSFISQQLEDERLSCSQSNNEREKHRHLRKNVDEDKNGIGDDELTSSVQRANSAQSSRDKSCDHHAEVANKNTATQTGDKTWQDFGTTGIGKSSQQQQTVVECTKNKSNEQVSNNHKESEVKNCALVEKNQLIRSNIEVTKPISETNQVTSVENESSSSSSSNNNNNNQILTNNNNNNNKPHFVQKYKINKNPEPNKTEDFPPNQTIITSNLANHNTFIATKLDQTALDDQGEFGCKRRRLSYLQSLLLRKWPYLAISICIMSSLLFGILLSALTLYLMHGVTDCSSYALSATRVNPLMVSQHERPSEFDSNTPIELASLTGHADLMSSSGSRLYAASGHLPGHSNSAGDTTSSAATTTTTTATANSGHKFRRLPGTLWPVHYDLFVQPYIFEPHFNFTGKVSIRIKCAEPTDNITLHTYELELNEKTLSLKLANNNKLASSALNSSQSPLKVPPKVKGLSSVKELQYSIILLDSPLEAGQEYVLGIDFVGLLNDDLAGFYKIKYERKDSSETTWIAATQFQATDARRAFPCFDEPLYKATFSIQIKHWKNMTALSNMPIIDRQDSPDGLWVTDTFGKTHRMSTYLVAYAVTDFESRSEGNISVWARPGFAHSAEYALKIAGKILRHYEDFFGIEYPLPKMDMIALPDFNAGAMENWGLITYRETAMLYDEKTSSVGNKLRVAVVVAHELAHQWFGNLVTPKWWDDLWLNEGFASYVEYIGVDFVEPTWRMLDQFVVDEVQNVFSTDSLSSSHQISIPVNNPDEISEIFDHISYAKGASIIRMMNHFLTEDVFKAGLRRYLNALKYNNAEQSDLWAHLTEAQLLANNNKTIKMDPELAVDVEKVMNSWTLQTGYPVVTLTRSYDNSKQAKLEQIRYSESSFGNQSTALSRGNISTPKTHNERWEIPITFTWKSERNWEPTTRLWMHQNDTKPVELKKSLVPKDDEWMLVNIRQVGYYRVNYDMQNWKLLINQLNTDHTLITAANRAQILDDLFEFARAGIIDYNFVMDATKYLKNEFDYLPWETVLGSFAYIDEMLSRTSLYGDWREYVANLIAPLYNRYKDKEWTVNEKLNNRLLLAGSSDNNNNNKTKPESDDLLDIYNQMNANAWACEVNEHCQQKARSLFDNWKQTGKNSIRPEHRFVTYCTAIEHGNRTDWDFLWRVYESEQNASEKDRLMKALGCSKELWVLARYLEWTFDKTKPIRRQDGAFVFRMIAKNPYGHNIAFNFMRDKWSTIKEYYGKSSFSLGNLIRSITVSMSSQIELNELLSFYESVKSDVGTGKRSFQNAIEEVEGNVLWRNRNYKKIQNWLQDGRKRKVGAVM